MKRRLDSLTLLVGIAMLAACWPGVSSAGVYKCVTAAGKVTYSDKPCAGNESRAGMDVKGMTYSSDEVIFANEAATEIIQEQREVERQEAQARGSQVHVPIPGSADRLRSLEMRAKSMAASPSEKAALNAEIRRIKDGSAGMRTEAEQKEVDAALRGAGSMVESRQRGSAKSLQEINRKYDSPETAAASEARKTRARSQAQQQERERLERQNKAAAAGIANGGTPWVPAAGGAIDPKSGEFKVDAAGGYVDPKTGKFVPVPGK